MLYNKYKNLIEAHTRNISNNPANKRKEKEALAVSKEKLKRVLLKMKNEVFGGEILYVKFRLKSGVFETFVKSVHSDDVKECFKFAFSEEFIEIIEIKKIKLGEVTNIK